MALNDSHSWDTDTPQDHKDAFMKSFGVHRILVPAGTEFYKLTQYPLVNPKNGSITPWWNYLHVTQVKLDDGRVITVPGFTDMQGTAARLNVTGEQFVRARSAVTKQWNKMDGLLQVRLNLDAWGYFGRNAAMPLDNDLGKKVVFIGGAYQVYIPKLSRGDMTEI
jgi:hypothetical protein